MTLIAAAINALIFVAMMSTTTPPMQLAAWLEKPYWIFLTCAVLITSLKLRGGGRALAGMMGARQVDPTTKDFKERQMINVVEEMSIASGTPVPALYVMDDETGINAFVAGTRPTETVLVITRGALDAFSRDELQGVIGHEYSHIFNNDMRINIQLMGILAGILLIGQLGRVMLYSGSRSRGKGSGQAAIIGLGILLVGYIGLFFGSLIKAAISRQREFLADASAVQFTRNPQGIAGALDKIKQHVDGSLLNNAHSEDVSHFCFGESVHYAFSSLMATHPRLEDRIEAVDPEFAARRLSEKAERETAAAAPDAANRSPLPGMASGFAGGSVSTDASRIAESVGTVTPEQIAFAEYIHRRIPQRLLESTHDVETAPQVIYAALLNVIADEDRHIGITFLREAEGADNAAAIEDLSDLVAQLPARARLPLVNIALPALKRLGEDRRGHFIDRVQKLIEIDRRYTIFEYALLHILRDHLSAVAERAPTVKYFKFEQISTELRILLSVLARVGAKSEDDAAAAFDRSFRPFGLSAITLERRGQCNLETLTQALDALTQLSPLLKKNVISACADCVIHDGKVTAAEAELLQVIALTLDCPMPPLLDA